ncbi:MAG: UDP-N-acetylmuramoyl-tripeptide--D-alanyl-D-alanine ligase [Actinomycetales bacterium]|nr:UDP-N-acetylmuramoyl-tripeptide--D-alanyl-D-alanine ligase [Actinomycetales bacterium]
MIRLTVAEVAVAVGGRIADGTDPAVVVTGPVVVDSRAVTPGCLFAALPGERVDGHDFAAAAVAAGAVATLGSRETGTPGVLVTDPLAALAALARHLLGRLPDLTVVGVTGSSGKTGTKDILACLLGGLGPTVAPEGSYNNELGVPLTALRAGAGTSHLVVEMGARHPGNITYLCGVTPPRIGVVLNVGAAHLGEFGSREVTAATKGELVEALPADGVAVLNADDPLVAAMAARAAARVVRFGESAAADVRAEEVRLDDLARPGFRLVTPAGSAPVTLALHGVHHVANALAAAAVAGELGMAPDEIAAALGDCRAGSRWRMEVTSREDGVLVVNDAYNANPDSTRAALKALATMGRPSSGPGRRTWAVLGEMLELGDEATHEHDAIGRLAVRLDVSRVVAVGQGARMIHEGAGREGSFGGESVWVPDVPAALDLLRDQLAPGDVVLVKASRAVGLDRLAEELLHDAAGAAR